MSSPVECKKLNNKNICKHAGDCNCETELSLADDSVYRMHASDAIVHTTNSMKVRCEVS